MNRSFAPPLVILACTLSFASVHAQEKPEEPPGTTAEDVTIITSDRLVFDNKQHFAFFESNVVVTDPAMKMTSDELKVIFDDKNKVKTILAQGHVVIEQDDRKAWAGMATYDVEGGKIVLSVKPRVRRNLDVLTGDTITFDRDDEKIICEPRAKLIIFPEQGAARKNMINLGD